VTFVNGLRKNRQDYVKLLFKRTTSGHAICMDDGYCGKPSDTAYKNKIIKDIQKDYGITFSGKWSIEEKMTVVTAVILIGTKLANATETTSGAKAFRDTFIPINFQRVNGVCGEKTDRCYADANAFPNTIRFYSSHWTRLQDENGVEYGNPFKMTNPAISISLAVHEIGHAFDAQTGRAFNNAVAKEGITNKDGFGKRIGSTGPTEITADLFTSYVMNALGPRSDGIDLQQFMQTNMADWINTASQYTWAGNQ
jgi:hypothetical protein